MNSLKAVVSGSAGFLGRRLSNHLVSLNIPVLGVDLGPAPFVMKGYQHIQTSLDQAGNIIVEHLHKGGVYFHMAGLADRKQCEERPTAAFAFNVALVFTALEICERLDDVRFVLPSTGIVYGLHLGRPAIEGDPVQPGSVYTGSKLAAEILVQAYAADRIDGAIVARLSNVYGPGAAENTVLGRLFGQVSRRESLNVFDERPVRDFIHVDDAVEALVRLGRAKTPGALVVNVSTGRGVKIGDAVEMLSGLSGLPHDASAAAPREPSTHLVLSNERLCRTTGWTPQIDLEQGLKICLKAF